MEESIFTKIINGELPGERLYEDDLCVVLMTIEPVTPGHCMVIPRQQVDHLWDVDVSTYTHLMNISKKVALAMRAAYDYPRIGEFVEGFGVPHTHIHLVGLNAPFETTMAEHLVHKHQASADELRTEADKIREHLI